MKSQGTSKSVAATVLVGLAAVIPFAQAKAAEPPPAFSFMGQDTEHPSTMTEIMGSACKQEGKETECKKFGGEIAGVKLKYISMKYHDGRLYYIYGAIWDHGLGDLLAAFSAKYGNPIAEKRSWQNKRGSTFDNPTFIWKFKCGQLELETLGWDIDSSSFEFACDANRPPPEEPVVDF
jgi:hypothetical protein